MNDKAKAEIKRRFAVKHYFTNWESFQNRNTAMAEMIDEILEISEHVLMKLGEVAL